MISKVAIIIVNYNGYLDTKACVESIQKIKVEKGLLYSIIVVDNGSSQQDEKCIEYLKNNTIFLEVNENKGFSGGNNIGIRYAIEKDYTHVLLLNNDTIVEVDFLDKLMKCVLTRTNVGAAIGKIYYYDEPDILWYAGGSVDYNIGMVWQHGNGKKDMGQYDKEYEVGFVTGCMMLIPIEVIKKIGVLEEDFFLYAEDLEYSLRIHANGFKMYYFPEAVIYHKVGASSGREEISMNTQYYMVRNIYKAFFKYQTCTQRVKSVAYNFLRHIKYILNGKYKFKIVLEAYRDIILGKTGKR